MIFVTSSLIYSICNFFEKSGSQKIEKKPTEFLKKRNGNKTPIMSHRYGK